MAQQRPRDEMKEKTSTTPTAAKTIGEMTMSALTNVLMTEMQPCQIYIISLFSL